jgi:hypothetical protein
VLFEQKLLAVVDKVLTVKIHTVEENVRVVAAEVEVGVELKLAVLNEFQYL